MSGMRITGILGILLVVVVCTVFWLKGGLATDQDLINTFRGNEAEFNALAQLIASRPQLVGSAEVRQRIAKLGEMEVLPSWNPDDQHIYFLMSATGYAVHSKYKGLLRSDVAVTPLLATLDDAQIPLHTVAFRKISDGWYLYLQRD